jgi:hypothetical protein
MTTLSHVKTEGHKHIPVFVEKINWHMFSITFLQVFYLYDRLRSATRTQHSSYLIPRFTPRQLAIKNNSKKYNTSN